MTTTSRTYGQSCPVAHALDMVGDRWALLVVRELRLGPRRFADLQTALPGIGPSVLTQRLRDLVANGVLERRPVPAPARGEMYALTDWGSELEPTFRALARWGARSPVVPLQGPISDDAVMLGVRTFLSVPVSRRRPLDGQFLVRLATDEYHLAMGDIESSGTRDPVSIVRGGRARTGEPDDTVDAVLETDATTLQRLLVGDDTGAITLLGDRRLARRLVHLLCGVARRT